MGRKSKAQWQSEIDQAWLAYYRNQAHKMLIEGLKKRLWTVTDSNGTHFVRNAHYRLSDGVSVTVK
jgi:hypothetical protein